MTVGINPKSITDVARAGLPAQAARIFKLQSFDTTCTITPELERKYNANELQHQTVISLRNQWTNDVTWFNPARKTKPQNFAAESAKLIDPTGGGGPGKCDFCEPLQLTATDVFGRVHAPGALSASNLFKYTGPHLGVVMLKHHDPNEFNLEQFTDLLAVAHEWFQRAVRHARSPSSLELHPLLVWNCLGRAGASQYHGHAQVMLSGVPLPTLVNERRACEAYASAHPTRSYYEDVVAAHVSLGLARMLRWQDNTAHAFASVCPYKDAEMVVHGQSLTCPSFQVLLFAALRGLIGGLGTQAFNVGIHNINVNGAVRQEGAPVVARVVGRGRMSSAASDFGGLEVFGGASIGHTDPWSVWEAFESKLSMQTIGEDLVLAADAAEHTL